MENRYWFKLRTNSEGDDELSIGIGEGFVNEAVEQLENGAQVIYLKRRVHVVNNPDGSKTVSFNIKPFEIEDKVTKEKKVLVGTHFACTVWTPKKASKK